MSNYQNFKDIVAKYVTIQEIIKSKKAEKELRTTKKCPRCKNPLYFSDIAGYEYVCPICDENFYEIEVE